MRLIPRGERSPLERVRQEFDRWLENVWSGGEWAMDAMGFSGKWSPRIDVCETPEAVLVTADLPGVNPRDIDISVTGNVLTISGERKEERETKDRNFVRTERFVGTFARSVPLPSTIDIDKVSAEARDGVLTITLPKREEAKPKQISVKVQSV